MTDDIKKRLESLGYTVTEQDNFSIAFISKKIESDMKATIHQAKLPAALYEIMIDRICGTFLYEKKCMGGLDNAEAMAVVKSISEGDINVTLADDTSVDTRFLAVVQGLSNAGENDILRHRKLVFK